MDVLKPGQAGPPIHTSHTNIPPIVAPAALQGIATPVDFPVSRRIAAKFSDSNGDYLVAGNAMACDAAVPDFTPSRSP